MKLVVTIGAVLALSLSSTTAVALAADAPDCGKAISLLADARVKADAGDVELERLRSTQKTLDAAVDAAQKALDTETDAAKIPAFQVALNVAKKAAADARKVLDDAVAKDDALGELVVKAQLVVSTSCKGADAPVVEKPQVKVLPKVAPATGGA